MIHKIKSILVALTVALTGVLAMAPAVVHADFKSDACKGVNTLNGSTDTTCQTGAGTAVNKIIKVVIQIFSVIVGFAAVIMVIVGGLKFITANGDSGAIASARTTILYAIIGLIVVALAQVLVHYVLTKTSGAVAPPPAA